MTRRPKPLELSAVRVQLARAVPLIRALLVIFEDLADDLEVDVGSSLRAEPVREQKIVQVRPRHPTAVNHVDMAVPEPVRHTRHASVVAKPAKLNGAREEALSAGELKVLIAVAQHGAVGVSNNQLTVLTGYKRSYRDLILRRLRRAPAYVETIGQQHTATIDGKTYLGSSFEPLPTGKSLRSHWLAKLPEGERRIFSLALGRYPQSISRDELSQETGYKRSYRDLCLRKLVARRLLEKIGRGSVAAAKMLFD